MGWNVPDDWGCYYRRCDRCGSKYHASEGGCGCWDNIPDCQCGQRQWDGDEDPRCGSCGTGPYQEGRTHQSIHVARKYHARSIRPGDKYRRVVQFGYFPDGAFTLTVRKYLLEKGPLWAVDEVMES
jgi:hypothetical protein